ncbi:MAG: sulfotransferase [Pseudomonadota bacterium]
MMRATADTSAMDLSNHAIPRFEGAQSRRHRRVAISRLRLMSVLHALRHARTVRAARSFVQFAGWPRSGHSLVGALIDAHPQAAIAHELDTMGLFHKGIAARRLPALCLWNTSGFTQDGRWWNGFRYDAQTGSHGVTTPLRVIGDKKGDWATRWVLHMPDTLDRLARESPLRPRWILVTRHPADNIATMSLRRSKLYDRLRIEVSGSFDDALRKAQADGDITSQADDDMIADYSRLARGVAQIKARTDPADWIEIVYEDLAHTPAAQLTRLEDFLGLDPDPNWQKAAAAMIRPSRRNSRDLLHWSEAQRAAVAEIISSHDFLEPYA